MKKLFLYTVLLISCNVFSQELNFKLFEKLNSYSLASSKELLVDGHGFLVAGENKYLHPKSTQETFLLINLSDSQFDNNTRMARKLEIICSSDFDLNSFKSELLEYGYNYDGSSKDDSINFKSYKKEDNKELIILKLSEKKYQIIFLTKFLKK
jgi:hypothetical protein